MDTAELPKELPSFTKEIEISVKGNLTNREYSGKFIFRIPNIRARSNISKLEARLNEGLTLDQTTSTLHYMLAYLRYTLVEDGDTKIPEWWKSADYGIDLMDPNVVTSLYLECRDYEKQWEEIVFGKRESE